MLTSYRLWIGKHSLPKAGWSLFTTGRRPLIMRQESHQNDFWETNEVAMLYNQVGLP